MSSRRSAARAGVSYWLIVFALGFALGTARVLWVEPRLGIGAATVVELPLMLGASWFACRWLIERHRVSDALGDRAIMGGLAFALLMVAEAGVSTLLFGRTLGEHLATYRDSARQVGLAAQLMFAAFPLFQRR